ncbi:MAG: hypothetical protein LBS50_08540 [Prevotellaceae bacterium]|jgi:hypothetical protein|nr:hypothetical protein [Prevotellaceae bacterium]
MQLIKSPYIYSFAGNPMRFVCQVSANENVYIRLRVRKNSPAINPENFEYSNYFRYFSYKKGNEYFVDFDVSSILQSYVRNLMAMSNYDMGEEKYEVAFYDENNNNALITTFIGYAIKGGIPLEKFLELEQQNINIFESRFQNIDSLFFFTNRQFKDNTLILRQSELTDICFFTKNSYYVSGESYLYQIRAGENFFEFGLRTYYDEKWKFIDLKAIYSELAPSDNILQVWTSPRTSSNPSVYDDWSKKFIIQVLPDPISEERYLLEFRNSIGVLEKILLNGEIDKNPEFSDTEFYQSNENNFLQNKYFRGKKREKIKISTGYRLAQEIEFMQDLLLSDEVFFIDENTGAKRAVNVTAEEFKWKYRQNVPESVMLTIDFLYDENYYLSESQIFNTDVLMDSDGNIILDSEGQPIGVNI